MRMRLLDRVNYPKFTKYVKNDLPTVADVPVIVKALERFGQIDRPTLQRALVWDEGPDIKVVYEDDIPGYGQFTPGEESNEIRIRRDVVQEFENGRGLYPTKSGRLVYLAGVTLLHELVHWADDRDGIQTSGEEGKRFEIAVYGKVIG